MTTRRAFLGRLLGGLAAAPLAKLLPTPPMPVEPALAPIAESGFPAFFPSGETVYLELSNDMWNHHVPPLFSWYPGPATITWDRSLTDAEVAAIAATETA